MNRLKILVLVVLGILVVIFGCYQIPAVQDGIIRMIAPRVMSVDFGESTNIRVFVCGTASPLGNTPDRAQACIAIVTPDHFYVFDAGAGSSARLTGAGLPMERLDGIFLTHFHSDHISDLPAMTLNSWVQGRSTPLQVFGPTGVNQITEGFNLAYVQDRRYRTDHHGSDFLPNHLGNLKANPFEPGIVLEEKGLTVTAFTVEHDPVIPAVGYRIDYQGRSVVISGDSIVSDRTFELASNADLLFHDALSPTALRPFIEVSDALGRDRMAKVMRDVMDYHADVNALEVASAAANVKQLVLYHMVPTPVNPLLLKIWQRDLEASTIIANDNMVFELPSGDQSIQISHE
ncbi:MAG: ribonuclease Z [Patiriisocius sp.]|jgi:ribonuclease Z